MTSTNSEPPHGWYTTVTRLLRAFTGAVASLTSAGLAVYLLELVYSSAEEWQIAIAASVFFTCVGVAFTVASPESHVTKARVKTFRFRTSPAKWRSPAKELPNTPMKPTDTRPSLPHRPSTKVLKGQIAKSNRSATSRKRKKKR